VKKLSRRQYIKTVADALVRAYGQDLKEYGTDVHMAESVVRGLSQHLYFGEETISLKDFKQWKKGRDPCSDIDTSLQRKDAK